MTPYEVHQLLAAPGQPRDDVAPVPEATAEDLDPVATRRFLDRVRATKASYADEDDEMALRRLRVLVRPPNSDAELVPSLAGLLTLGRNPQDFLPQLNITFVHYPGVEGAAGDVRTVVREDRKYLPKY